MKVNKVKSSVVCFFFIFFSAVVNLVSAVAADQMLRSQQTVDNAFSKIEVKHGAMVFEPNDVIVNLVNEGVISGEGIDKTISDKAGPQLKSYFEKRKVTCAPGTGKFSPGFNTTAYLIVHAVPPKAENTNSSALLARVYNFVLEAATFAKKSHVKIPFISTEGTGLDAQFCAQVAVETAATYILNNSNTTISKVTLLCQEAETPTLQKVMENLKTSDSIKDNNEIDYREIKEEVQLEFKNAEAVEKFVDRTEKKANIIVRFFRAIKNFFVALFHKIFGFFGKKKEKPTTDTDKPTADTDKPIADTDKPTADTDKPTVVNDDENATDGNNNDANNNNNNNS